MSWALSYVDRLRAGETITIKPKGNSMLPRIKSGDECVIVPLDKWMKSSQLPIIYPFGGLVVLCKVKGKYYLHKILAKKKGQYLIGNNKGRENGWITIENIYGVCTNR